MKNDTRLKAQGRWGEILQNFGFTPKQLSGLHQSCPICGGDDRFRFTDYKRGGEYFCNGCGAGSGFDLLMRVNGWSFSHAAKLVDEVVGSASERPVFSPEADKEKRRSDLNSLWRGATSPDLVRKYLGGRGIDIDSLGYDCFADVRGHSGIYLKGSPDKQPAILSLIRSSRGDPISIHRTYIRDRQKRVMPPTEKMTGASVWLGRPKSNGVVVGEGIETTLSGMAVFGMSYGLSAISANNMETLAIPRNIKNVIILADNDRSFTGQRAAFYLGRRLDSEGKRVDIVLPRVQGLDYNDILVGGAAGDFYRFKNRE